MFTYIVRDSCRHKIVIMASCRYIRDKPCRNILVFVVPLCFTEMLVDLLDSIGNRIQYP